MSANAKASTRAQSAFLHACAAGLLFSAISLGALSITSVPLAAVALVPLAWAVLRVSGTGWSFFLGLLLGVSPWWFVQQWWTWRITAFGTVPLVMYLSLTTAAPVWGARWVLQRRGDLPAIAVFATAWTGIEWLRGEWLLGGYAWGFVGHPLIDFSPARWLGSQIGVLGVGFACAAVSMAVVLVRDTERWTRWSLGRVGAGSLLLAALLWMGQRSTSEAGRETGRMLRAGLVQTNVPQSNKVAWSVDQQLSDYQRFAALSYDASRGGKPDLIVWPETMVPGPGLDGATLRAARDAGLVFFLEKPVFVGEEKLDRITATAYAEALETLQSDLGVPMLVGAESLLGARVVEKTAKELGAKDQPDDAVFAFVEQDARFNSAFLVRDGTIEANKYDKVRRTPMGEYVPLLDAFPKFRDAVTGLAADGARLDLAAGKERTVFAIPLADGSTARVVTPICFESASSSHCRRLCFDGSQRRADAMVCLTNDGWFGSSRLARGQHLTLARWRCVETATPMLRCANTGVSAAIDATGKVIARGVDGAREEVNLDGVLSARVALPASTTTTGAVLLGDAAGWGSLLLFALYAVASLKPGLPRV
jgi:apolipoprotein N-acyltransferase